MPLFLIKSSTASISACSYFSITTCKDVQQPSQVWQEWRKRNVVDWVCVSLSVCLWMRSVYSLTAPLTMRVCFLSMCVCGWLILNVSQTFRPCYSPASAPTCPLSLNILLSPSLSLSFSLSQSLAATWWMVPGWWADSSCKILRPLLQEKPQP